MQTNYTLKQAVITALTILAFGAETNALALGLGNIDVKSYLGQPLRATIKIQGASDLKGDTCFKVINDSDTENQLSSANFKLSKAVDDVAILTVTTNQIINEPIVNLSVLAECDSNMRRDYVLLLDPLLTAEDENSADEVSGSNDDKTSTKENSKVETSLYKQTIKVPVAAKKSTSTKKHRNGKKANKNIVLKNGNNIDKSTETLPSSSKNNVTKEAKPRLTISGGGASYVNLNSTELRLDKQLHFTPETASQALATDTEIQDEATVMSHRLAHLEKQISALAQTNQKLKTDNQHKTQQLEQANSMRNKLDWLGYILGGGLLISSLTVADKWRRRRQIQRLENARLEWANHNETANDLLEEFDTNDNFFESETHQTFNSDAEKSAEKSGDAADTEKAVVPFSVEEFNSDHNILDHADVFLSHGRTSLAIQLLQNHLLEFPKQSVTVWMFLLDLLAKENLQAGYEQAALECKEHFNIQIADFSKPEVDSANTLDSFPRITAGLQQAWGSPAALTYLDDLIYNSRLEIRVGFHKNIIEELILLRSIAQEELKTAEVIQMDEKKLAMKELKEVQLAAKKEEKLEKMHEIALADEQKKQAAAKLESKEAMFEFNLVEFK